MGMKKILKSKLFWTIAIIILLIGGYALTRGKNSPTFEFAQAKRGDIVQEVDVTGKIKSAENTELSFEKSGKVVFVGFKTNDKVSTGQVIMRLNDADILAQYNQGLASIESAKASSLQYSAALESQIAKLEELKKGTRPEDIAVKQTELENAK